MPLIEKNNIFKSGRQSSNYDAVIAEYDKYRKGLQKTEQKPESLPEETKYVPVEGPKIPEDFGRFDANNIQNDLFKKQQESFDEEGNPVNIKKPLNTARMDDALKYINGGLTPKEAKKIRDNNAQKVKGEIDRLELKKQLDPTSFSKDDFKALNKAYSNYDVYKMTSDPIYAQARFDQMAEQNQQLEDELKSVQQPEDYFINKDIDKTLKSVGTGVLSTITNSPIPSMIGQELVDLISSAYTKSAASQYVLKQNETQAATSAGKIDRALELDQLGANVDKFLDYAEQLYDINHKLAQYSDVNNLTIDQANERMRLLRQRNEAYAALEQYSDDYRRFSSWRPIGFEKAYKLASSTIGKAIGKIGGASARDVDEIELEIPTLTGAYGAESLKKYASEGSDPTAGKSFYTLINDLKLQMKEFHKKNSELRKQWSDERDSDLKDIEDWRTGNNWLGAKLKTDNYFKALEQLAEMNGMNPTSAQTLLFAQPGLLGASNSSWFKSVAGLTAKAVGTVASVTGTGGLAIPVIAGVTSFTSDVSQGQDENNAEVHDGVTRRFDSTLKNQGLYDDFMSEGFNKLKDDPMMLKFRQRFKNATTPKKNEEVQSLGESELVSLKLEMHEYIRDSYLAGKWHSSNPKNTKAQADAIMGANNYYYNDLFATTRDAFGDALLTCLPINPAINAIKGKLGLAAKTAEQVAGQAAKATKEGLTNMLVIQSQLDRALLLGRGIPSVIRKRAVQLAMGTAKAGEAVGKIGLAVASEVSEESEQKLNTDEFVSGKLDKLLNGSISGRIWDDMTKGVPATWDYFFNGGILGMSSDLELLSNQNGAVILSLPMALLTQTPGVVIGARKKMSAYDVVWQAAQLMKSQEMGTIKQGELYAKHLDEDDKKMILNMFDKFEAANRDLRTRNQIKENNRENDAAIPIEWILEQRQRFLDFYAHANNSRTKGLAEQHGIKFMSDAYGTYVGIDQMLYDKLMDAVGNLANARTSQVEIQDDVYKREAEASATEDITVDQLISQYKAKDNSLASLSAAYDMKEEAEAVSEITGLSSYNKKSANNVIKTLTANIKDRFGLDIQSRDDILKYVTDSESFEKFKEREGDILKRSQSVRMIKGQIEHFRSDPKQWIEKYKTAVKQDEALEQAIEEDYQNSLDIYKQIEQRAIQNRDIYLGKDKRMYKVSVEEDGTPIKRLYDPEKKSEVGDPLEFDKEEYHLAKVAQEKEVAEAEEHKRKLESDDKATEKKSITESPSDQEEKPAPTAKEEKEKSNTIKDSKDREYTPGLPEGYTVAEESADKVDERTGNEVLGWRDIKTSENEKRTTVLLAVKGPDGKIRARKVVLNKKDAKKETKKIKADNTVVKKQEGSAKVKDGITKVQQDTINALKRRIDLDNKSVLRDKDGNTIKTGHDYFFKFKNGIVRYIRVHGLKIMDGMFASDKIEGLDELTKELQELQATDKEAYKARIKQLQDEFNKDLAEKYGEDSLVYAFHKINLSVYGRKDLLDDIGIPEAIAQIVLRDIPNASVISGTIIDFIARKIFGGEYIKYHDSFMDGFKISQTMSEETFNSLIDQLKRAKDHYENDLGWVLDTNPHIWKGKLKNGLLVAGETDMIAIDQDGFVHILDFKTTKMLIEEREEYRNPEYDSLEEGSQEWIPIAEDVVVPEGAERRMFSQFVLEVPKGAKRSYGQQYVRQLTAYTNLVTHDEELRVKDVQLVPIYTEKEYGEKGKAELEEITSTEVHNLINLTSIPELTKDIDEVNSYLQKQTKNPYTSADIKNYKNTAKGFLTDLQSWKKFGISDDTKKRIEDLIKEIDQYIKRLDGLLKNKSKMNELATIDEYDNMATRIGLKMNAIKKHVQEEDEESVKKASRKNLLTDVDDEYVPLFDEAPEGAEDTYVDEEDYVDEEEYEDEYEDEDIDEDEQSSEDDELDFDSEDTEEKAEKVKKDKTSVSSSRTRWHDHNNLAGVRGLKADSVIKKLEPLFKRVHGENPISVKNDFIENAKFVVYKDGKYYKVDITYGDKTFKGLLLNVGIDSRGNRSKYGKHFISQFKSLVKDLKKGQQIVASEVHRTNGKLVLKDENGKKNKDIPFVDSMFVGEFNQEFADTLIDGKDSLLGLSDGEVVTGLSETSGNENPTIYAVVKDDDYDKAITAGTIVYLHKFRYAEDDLSDEPRVIPIPLNPKYLSEGDVNTVIDILKKGPEELDNDFVATVKTKDGTKKMSISKLSNRRVLNMLCRFGGQAEKQGSNFIFDFVHDEYGNIKNGKLVTISDLRRIKVNGKYPQVEELDITTPAGINTLTDILRRVRLHCNQKGDLRHNLNGHVDPYSGNPYKSIVDVFENEDNGMDIESSIIISDSIVFDGRDVYSSDDKSRGLSGAAWMIKHGILLTNVHGIEDPLISIRELEIENVSEEKPKKKSEKKSANSKKKTEKEKKVEQLEEVEELYEDDQTKEKIEDVVEQHTVPNVDVDKSEEEIARQEKIARIRAIRGLMFGGGVPGAKKPRIGGRHKIVTTPGTTKRDQNEVKKNLYKIFGKYIPNVQWCEDVIEKLAAGCVVGRMMPDVIQLYEAIEPGVEYHEAFHRILDILTPPAILEKLQQRYKERHGQRHFELTGEELTESDISEAMADQFMMFKMNNKIETDKGIIELFKSAWSYVKSLYNLKDWQLAAMYVAVNTGLFRHIKPNKNAIERFNKVTSGYRDMSVRNLHIRNAKTGEMEEFEQFSNYEGRKLYDAALEGILYALIVGQNVINYKNVNDLDTSLDAIKHLDFTSRPVNKDEDMSPWFKVVTGAYIYDDTEFTTEDAVLFEMMYSGTPVMEDIEAEVYDELGDASKEDLDLAVIDKIIETESQKTSIDQLLANQRMMHEMMKHRDVLHQQLERKLKKLAIQSEKVQNTENEGIETESWLGEDIAVHDYSEFYKHSRAESASAAVIFFLSTIPDIRFVEQRDVDAGIVDNLFYPSGDRRTIPNGTNLLGYKQFVPFKIISNRLLNKCHKCRNAKELDEALTALGENDAVFNTIAKRFHRHYYDQLYRHEDGTPKVYTRILNPKDDSVEFKMLDKKDYQVHQNEDGTYFITYKNGKAVQGARFLINYDEESLVTQLWQYIRCQRLDFTHLNIKTKVGEDGRAERGKSSMKMVSTDSDYASTIYPRDWFNRLKSPAFGIFRAKNVTDTNKKRLEFDKKNHGKKRLLSAISNIIAIRKAFKKGAVGINKNSTVTVTVEYFDNEKNVTIFDDNYKLSLIEDFGSIEDIFVTSLNTLGINIDKDVFEECICNIYGTYDVQQAMYSLVNSGDKRMSLSAFVKDIDHLAQELKEGDMSVIQTNKKADTKHLRSSEKYQYASGIYLFSESAFVKSLAQAYSRHQRMTKELMTLGPNKTKRYTMAQCHTASIITDELTSARMDDSKSNIIGSELANDMAQYSYNLIFEQNPITLQSVPRGCRILKSIYNGTNGQIVLHTHGGIKTERSKTGGQDYTQMKSREDILSKIEMLTEGAIIFPTLADKSTWFYLTGCALAGIDYSGIKRLSFDEIPDIVERDGGFRIEYGDYSKGIDSIDQLLEYAKCEHETIRQELKRKKHLSVSLKIKNFLTGNQNALRYASMTEFYTFDEKENAEGSRGYKAEMHLLTDYGKTPEKCFEEAEDSFWKGLSKSQRRRSVVMNVQKIVEENLKYLEDCGLIKKVTEDKSPLLGYSNVGLNDDIISALADRIEEKYRSAKLYKNLDKDQRRQKAENHAIVAYMFDICTKSIQSCEETERIYTGMPQFFKWKHGKVTDPITGKTYDCVYDRYDDEVKRNGGLGSTGDQNRSDLYDENQEYVCAECNDPKVGSEVYFGYEEGFIDNEIREQWFDDKKEEFTTSEELEAFADSIFGENKMSLDEVRFQMAEKYGESRADSVIDSIKNTARGEIRSYRWIENEDGSNEGGIAVADGAAYITPDMTKTLLRQRGALTTEVEAAFSILDGTFEQKRDTLGIFNDPKYKNISSENPLSNSKAYRIIMNALISTQKYSAYGYRLAPATEEDKLEGLGKIPVHYYDKYALFPIFPQIATGKMKDMLTKMEQQEIDMIMMDDAVKVGGCGSKDFEYSNQEEFDKFEFVTYKLKYKYVRRQLNTNPKEDTERSIGTQMLKVALAGLIKSAKYSDHSGKDIRGWKLVDRINKELNALSDIGEKSLRLRFFKDGEFDIEEFSNFLEDQLSQRNADANLLDGIQVVTGETTGKKRLKVPIEAMSSSGWIESIINSIINHEVIDTVSNGNAYYQRSVFGVEDASPLKAAQDNGRTLYNGKTLKAINEDGSMDAAISIDYFTYILPKEIANNFDKARQWLIDNKIIGKNAKANTIGYRIPTQSRSSIHPLRFVDVLPVVRDTIILPKDFTAITGSDFDIDKLYLASLHYNKVYEEKEVTDKKGNKKKKNVQVGATSDIAFPEDITDEDYRKQTLKYVQAKKHYQNALLFDYLTVLKDRGKIVDGKYIPGNSAHTSYRPVDKDTQLIDDFIADLEAGTSLFRFIAYKAGSLAYQVAKKIEFMVGKIGIGPYALNNNSQILTQTYGVRFKKYNTVITDNGSEQYPTILECMKASSLANAISKKKNRILSWLSGLINIHVDVAKDPKPKKLNINDFTHNLTALLIRIGLDENALAFVRQPIMVELAKVSDNNSGEYLTDPGRSASQNVRYAIKEWIEDHYKNGNDKDYDLADQIKGMTDTGDAKNEAFVGNVLKQLMGIDDDGNFTGTFDMYDVESKKVKQKEGYILRDILMNAEARKNPKGSNEFSNLKDDDTYLYVVYINGQEKLLNPKDILLWVYYAYRHLDKYAQALSDVVSTIKIDTKKQGKNIIEQKSYLDKMKDILNPETSLFEQEGLHAMYGLTYEYDPDSENEWDNFKPVEATEGSVTHDYEISSFIGHKTMNAMKLYQDIMQHVSIQASPSFIATHRRLLDEVGGSVRDVDRCKALSDAMMQYIKSSYMFRWIHKEGMSPKKLLVGDDSVQDMLISIQNLIKRDKTDKYWEYENNSLLKSLVPDIYQEEEGEENYRFIKLDNSFLDEQDDINNIEEAWDQLLSDDVTEFAFGDYITTPLDFAKHLIAYSFITSADTHGMTKFFKYVPNSWRTQSHENMESYADFMDSVLQNGFAFTEDDLEELIRNNWEDSDFVKELARSGSVALVLVNPWRKNKREGYKTPNNIPTVIACIKKKKTKIGGKTKTQLVPSVSTLLTNGEFPMFIRRRRPEAPDYSSDSYLLYKLVYEGSIRTIKANGEEDVISYPIYAVTYPKGKSYRAGSYTYDIFQYTDPTVYQQKYDSKYNTFGNEASMEAIEALMDHIDGMNDGNIDVDELLGGDLEGEPTFRNPNTGNIRRLSIKNALAILKQDDRIDDDMIKKIAKAVKNYDSNQKALSEEAEVKETEQESSEEQNDDEGYSPLFDEAPKGTEDNFDDTDEYPDDAAMTCKKGGKK